MNIYALIKFEVVKEGRVYEFSAINGAPLEECEAVLEEIMQKVAEIKKQKAIEKPQESAVE